MASTGEMMGCNYYCYCRCNCKCNMEEKEKPKEEADSCGGIILGISIHCDGCADEIRKVLRGIDGVEKVDIDSEKNRVTVKGKADPIKVANRLRKKTCKSVELISPKPKQNEEKKQKEKEPAVVEVAMKVSLHCDGCATDVRRYLYKLTGVQCVQIDRAKSLVSVKGTVEAKKLVSYLEAMTGKHIEIAKPESEKSGKDKEQKQENGQCSKKCCCMCYNPELLYAPQLFSDENPNSCSVM